MRLIDSGLTVRYDEKRCGWHVSGQGFDFFAYRTDDGAGNDFIECDRVIRSGDDRVAHIEVAFGGAKALSPDVVETALLVALRKHWPLNNSWV